MLASHVQVAGMQNLPDQDARRGLHLIVAAFEHPFGVFVHLPGPCLCGFQPSEQYSLLAWGAQTVTSRWMGPAVSAHLRDA